MRKHFDKIQLGEGRIYANGHSPLLLEVTQGKSLNEKRGVYWLITLPALLGYLPYTVQLQWAILFLLLVSPLSVSVPSRNFNVCRHGGFSLGGGKGTSDALATGDLPNKSAQPAQWKSTAE